MRSRTLLMSVLGSVISTSSRNILPPVGCSSLLMHRSIVDLPDPDGPRMTTTSPVATSRSTPLRTSSVPKDLRSPWMRTIGPLIEAAHARLVVLCDGDGGPGPIGVDAPGERAEEQAPSAFGLLGGLASLGDGELGLQRPHPVDQRDGDDQVVHGGHHEGREAGSPRHQVVRVHHQFEHSDRRQKRGVLEQQDEFGGHRRQDALDRLRDDHVPHRLPVGHPERRRSLELSLVDRLDPGAEDLGQVGRAVQGEDYDAAGEPAHVDAGDGQADEHDVDLQQQRRAAHHVDVEAGDPSHGRRSSTSS